MTSKVQYYLDENIPAAVARGLRLRGVDLLTTQETGRLGPSDAAQLALAVELQRVFVTQDADFLALHQQGWEHAGLVYTSPYTPIGDAVRGLLLSHDLLTPDEIRGQVEFV